MKRDEDLVKLSVSNKVVLYAKKNHGDSSVIIQMTADSKNWLHYLETRMRHFSPDANYIVDGAETLNEIVKLSTLGFKIIHLNISWIERFNRLLTQHGKTIHQVLNISPYGTTNHLLTTYQCTCTTLLRLTKTFLIL